jgi:hypothetical protein
LIEDISIDPPVEVKFTESQEQLRMQIRMHIIEESKAEHSEMPQEWRPCTKAQKGKQCCLSCGTLIDLQGKEAIKEPRFMKVTNHLNPMQLFN